MRSVRTHVSRVVLVLVGLLSSLVGRVASAQRAAPDSAIPRQWIELAVGFVQARHMVRLSNLGVPLLAVGVNLAREWRPGLLAAARLQRAEELCVLGCEGRAAARLDELGLLVGLSRRGRMSALSVASGVALVAGRRYPPNDLTGIFRGIVDHERIATIGLPVELALFLTPFEHVGVGVAGRADINSEASFVGASFGLRVGNLRFRR